MDIHVDKRIIVSCLITVFSISIISFKFGVDITTNQYTNNYNNTSYNINSYNLTNYITYKNETYIQQCPEESVSCPKIISEMWFSTQTNIGPVEFTNIYFDAPDGQKGIIPSMKSGESRTIFGCDDYNISCFIFPEYRIK